MVKEEVVRRMIRYHDKSELEFRVKRRFQLFRGFELDIPKNAHRYFIHLTNCYTYGFYLACVPLVGMCLEFVLKEFIVKVGGKVKNSDELGNVIQKAIKYRIIERKGWDKMKKINKIRKKYVHVHKTKFEKAVLDGKLKKNIEIRVYPSGSQKDALEAINLLSNIFGLYVTDKVK